MCPHFTSLSGSVENDGLTKTHSANKTRSLRMTFPPPVEPLFLSEAFFQRFESARPRWSRCIGPVRRAVLLHEPMRRFAIGEHRNVAVVSAGFDNLFDFTHRSMRIDFAEMKAGRACDAGQNIEVRPDVC